MLQLLTGLLPIGEKLVERLIPDPAARAKAMQELKDMEQKGELAKLEAEYADRDSARRRETAIATSENASWLNKTVTPILALGTVSMSFGLFLIISSLLYFFKNSGFDIPLLG